ncbi:MAG: DUF547 domain-containing protein [Bacteroidetes bacterium]|jgi:hypothetical protein|nr:DUF547 domain-containing protein [Bacteroidota bacterium]
MTILLLAALLLSTDTWNSEAVAPQDTLNEPVYAELSMELVKAVRDGRNTEPITKKLADVPPDELYHNLDTEPRKKAFWLNIYNAYVQILLLDNPGLFEDRNSWFGYNFFTSPQVTIAGKELSFDDIEHGIMRRSKIKLSMGYLDQWFVDDFIERFWWDEVDPRIHFALNCGAASCPYIAVYDPDRVEEQLDITTKNYLEKTTDYYPEEQEVEVNRLMSWFRADFGGTSGAIQMLKQYNIIPENADPSISFKEYDWTLELGNYQDI